MISNSDIQKIVESRHDAPHRVLGVHALDDGSSIAIRAFLPHAERVSVQFNGSDLRECRMQKIHPDGLFEATISASKRNLAYQYSVIDSDGNTVRQHDPYVVNDVIFSRDDAELFVRGEHSCLFEKLGAHPAARRDIQGVSFAVWAPNAQRVSVVGIFNRWDGRCHPMRRRTASGIWELFIPGIKYGDLYKYEIKTANNDVLLKSDPFARRTEALPNTASIVNTLKAKHDWRDSEWMDGGRVSAIRQRGVSIYLLQGDDWFREKEESNSEMEGAKLERLVGKSIAKIRQAGFTHVEIPVSSSGCWGSASFFAPGSDSCLPLDLVDFIDLCHRQGVGVIVPTFSSQFPVGLEDMSWFDGTLLYEKGEPHGSHNSIFDLDKGEVRSLFLSNARFWLEQYHTDGLVTDRIGSKLYKYLLRQNPSAFSGVRLVAREAVSMPEIEQADVDRILRGRHHDPFTILGPHYLAETQTLTIRALALDADQVYALLDDEPEIIHPLQAIHEDGLFEVSIGQTDLDSSYRLRTIDGGGEAMEFADAYAYTDFSFTQLDEHLFAAGNHYRIYEKLGAHPQNQGGVSGVGFAVWAPNAEGVSVIGGFNHWEGRRHQMKRHGASGVWEIFVPGVKPGELYKYEIRAQQGDTLVKTDPYAFFAEVPPSTASIVQEIKEVHAWNDNEWMLKRQKAKSWEQPVAIYEVHLGSWMRCSNNRLLSYRELADKLIPYVKDLGFNYIELLPIAEHPYEPSWGYQVSNFFAPTSRLGRPEELMALIDKCHQSGIGVILDWVPGHFPKDAYALARFDDTSLYEHADPRKGEHRDWGTLIFNYGRHEVENFLIANALFWLETYHFDGLRVDAVASMLYLDYSRQQGDWIPNVYGGNENLEAIEFIKHTNSVVHERFPGIMMIAEESTAWPKVSMPIADGGLGFGFKWNMGWMHDTLAYMSSAAETRKHHHSKLTFGLHYAFNENFVLSLSHDEVVHLKRSLVEKMPGDEGEKFANLRLLYTYMYGHPGKKLLFMGGEFGQKSEWNHAQGLDWQLLESEPHRCLQDFWRDLNRLYRSEPAFFETDFRHAGFEWLDVDSAEQCVIAFLRKAKDPRNTLLFAFNFSAIARSGYRIGVPFPVSYIEIFNSNAKRYGGSGSSDFRGAAAADEVSWNGHAFSIKISLAALSAIIFKPAAPDTRSLSERREPIAE